MMNKIGKALKALWWIARKPVLLNRVLSDEDSWQEYVGKKYGLAGGLSLVSMGQLGINESLSLGPMTFLDGGSLPTDMMLLAGLAEGISGCRYFEIGTWRGESVANVSSRCSSCYTLSLTDEEMRSIGMHEKYISAHRQFSKNIENVSHLSGNSLGFDFAALDQKFDLVFIDGDHHYDSIVSDTRNVFQHLVHDRSIVVWHDYGFYPDRVRFEVLAAILDGVGKELSGRIYQVAHTMCAIYTGSEFESGAAEFPADPQEFYKFDLSRKVL
jgi:methyltransferase family protein